MVSIARSWELKGIEEGLKKGRKKEKIIIAKNLIKAGLKTDLIITSTGLKKEETEKLYS
ncbi:MAG TPA: transposase [Rickettsia endosymbiont of Pyrocoelia pectoralis]|nr:transposase [Rickettsia endosymbiont of Pyrocoelia pectoralis]